MKKIEIITRPEKLEEVKKIFSEMGHDGMTVSMVSGCGLQKGRKEVYRGTEISVNLLPKIKIEAVIADHLLEGIISHVVNRVRTGEIGDGKIFVYEVFNVVKIRTGERGTSAI